MNDTNMLNHVCMSYLIGEFYNFEMLHQQVVFDANRVVSGRLLASSSLFTFRVSEAFL